MNLFSIIKERLSIFDVVSQYVTLKKVGFYYKGVCPFHTEKTASFTVSPHRNIFYCFGCHAGGDLIEFVCQIEHCNPRDAATHLIEQYRLEIPEQYVRELPKQSASDKERYHALHGAIAQWAHQTLLKSPAVQQYLYNRAITPETIKKYIIGYFPAGPHAIQSLLLYIQKQNFIAADLVQYGITQEGRTALYSPFENRIIFPINDHLGRTCGFGGRIFVKNDDRAKYYNSRENEFFNKKELLFGLDLAKSTIQKQEIAFIVEGYMDCIALAQQGFNGVIATMGTACTTEQLKLIARYAHTVYILYDGDNAGQHAVMRIAHLCWQVNLELKIVTLPSTSDPASLLEKKESITPYIEQAQDIFSYTITRSHDGFAKKNVAEKMAAIEELLQIINTIQEPLKKELILQQVAHTFNFSIDILTQELKKRRSVTEKTTLSSLTTTSTTITEEKKAEDIPILEKKIFSVIINSNGTVLDKNDEYVEICLSEPLRGPYQKLRAAYQQNCSFEQFFESLTSVEKKIISAVIMEYPPAEQNEHSGGFTYLLDQLRKKYWKKITAQISSELAQATQEQNHTKVQEILSHFERLRKKLLHKELV